MSGILSAISGKFSQALILGTVAPVAAFVILFLIVGVPLIPTGFPLIDTLDALDVSGKIIVISLGILVLSLLLYNLNIPIVRWYEGYPWEATEYGKWRTGIYRSRLQNLIARAEGVRPLGRKMTAMAQAKAAAAAEAAAAVAQAEAAQAAAAVAHAAAAQPMTDAVNLWRQNDTTKKLLDDLPAGTGDDEAWQAVLSAVGSARSELLRQINGEFPKESLILPTRLGNVIRSCEYYPDREYGMDAVTLWPRLVAVFDPPYAGAIDDAKTGFDFMLNGSVLSLLMLLLLLGLGLAYPIPFSSWERFTPWLATCFACIAAAFVFYQLSIERAAAWGEMVKGAFDLYKEPLRKKLGYTQELPTRKAEKQLWDSISLEMIYGGWPPAQAPDYAPAPAQPLPHAEGEPADIALEVTRGVRLLPGRNVLQVVLSVRNPDAQLAVANVKLKEQVPAGLEYVWDSIEREGGAVTVSGSNPYTFGIGAVAPGQSVTLAYRVLPRAPQDKGGNI